MITDRAYLHCRHLHVVQYAPDAPVTGEPYVGVDGKEVVHGPRHVDAEGNTLTERLEETRCDGHHIQSQSHPPRISGIRQCLSIYI